MKPSKTVFRRQKLESNRGARRTSLEHSPRLPFLVVGLGAAAGGQAALIEFLRAVPATPGLALVIVQPLAPENERLLPSLLRRHTTLPVAEVKSSTKVQRDNVYVIRPGRTLTVRGGYLRPGPPTSKPQLQRPVDDFFRSLALEQRERAVCVVLSGAGTSGSSGAQAIKAMGGLCVAQDPETAKFPSMPRTLIDTEVADFVLSPAEMPVVIARYAAHPYVQGHALNAVTADGEKRALDEIIAVTQKRAQSDFSACRKSTILRRVQRRMAVNQFGSMVEYLRLLQQATGEAQVLADELSTRVPGFFRDPKAWQALKARVISPLLSKRKDGDTIRAWVTSCSSGEDAYTVAILLLEAAASAGRRIDLKVFATETTERALRHARAGIFPGGIESDVSPERLKRFFQPRGDWYEVREELRDIVVFAPHRLLQDPSFSRLDLCICRDALMDLEPAAQRRAIELLQVSLGPSGCLMLGRSDGDPPAAHLFEAVDRSHQLFRRRDTSRRPSTRFSSGNGDAIATNDEELATSKTELQLLNRKLSAVNGRLQAELETLKTSASVARTLLQSTAVAVVYLDPEQRVRHFTPAISDLFDLIPSDTGRPLSNLAAKFTDSRLTDDVRAVLNGSEGAEQEVTSHTGRTYSRRVLPYREENAAVDGVVITFVDISARKTAELALRNNETRNQLMLEGIREYAIFMLDASGHFVAWTPGAVRIFGYAADEALAQPFALIFPPEDRERRIAEDALSTAAAQGSVSIERWHVRKDGSQFWATGTLSRLRDEHGQSCGFVNVVRDNTDGKRAEDSLREAMINAEAANASKDHFLANVSHELRTPMSATLLWAKLLNDQKTMDPDLLREGLSAIHRSAKEQQALIEDLMDTAKIVAGKMRLEPRRFDLNKLIQTLLPPIRSQAAENRLIIDETFDPDVGIVEADPRRLQQVVSNLLNNALKFTPASGRISVVTRRRGDAVQIRVVDTGKGISTEFLNRIFERFVQVEHGTTPTASGMGLGLAIARQLVELHGGTIRAESPGRDQGSSFVIDLPLPRESGLTEDDRSEADVEIDLVGWRILLVEDSTQTRQALATVLEESGAQVTAVSSEEAALEAYEGTNPDVILSDIGLGTSSGHHLISEIRTREIDGGRPPVPAMALTAYADEKNRRKAFECGFQDCATKPIEPKELLARLANLGVKR